MLPCLAASNNGWEAARLSVNSAQYRRWNFFHLAGSWPNLSAKPSYGERPAKLYAACHPDRAAIKRYWKICGCPGDPVYLLTIIGEHRSRKVCYWHVMAELRRLRLHFQTSS
jgi:hypothetical protein